MVIKEFIWELKEFFGELKEFFGELKEFFGELKELRELKTIVLLRFNAEQASASPMSKSIVFNSFNSLNSFNSPQLPQKLPPTPKRTPPQNIIINT